MGKNEYYTFGHDLFGPFLYGFTKWLREKIKKNGDRKIFFFSRDGFLMQKAYDLLEKEQPLGLEQYYVYFSRNSLRRGLLWHCDSFEKSLRYLSKRRFIEMAEVASYYGLERDELDPVLREIGIEWNENLTFDTLCDNKKVKTMYERFENVIMERSRNQYDTVIGYLKQINMDGQCAIVDIGWHGTMQYYLEQLIEIAGLDIKVNGYYVGSSPIEQHKGKSEGYLFCEQNLALRKSVLCFLGGYEKLFQSLEGSTDGYFIAGKEIVPVLKPYEYEKDREIQSYIMNLQTGALDYVKQGVRKHLTFDNEQDAYSMLIRFGKNPSYAETQMFRFFYIADGGKSYFLPQKPIYKYNPKELMQALSNSVWKTGFMKAAFHIPFPYYWIYNIIRK